MGNRESEWTAFTIAVSKGHAATVEVLRAAGANPLVGTSVNANAFAIMGNQHRQRALGKALPALKETLSEHGRHLTGGYAKERPMLLKYTKAKEQQKLLLRQQPLSARQHAGLIDIQRGSKVPR